MSNVDPSKQPEYVKKICETYKPNLAEGIKKMSNFVGILFEYILHVANQYQDFEPFVKILRKLAESSTSSRQPPPPPHQQQQSTMNHWLKSS